MENLAIENVNKTNFLVLHKIVDDTSFTQWEDVPKNFFIKILNEIQLTSRIHINNKRVHNKKVLLTFDDGNSSDYEIVFPMLLERKINAIFFLIMNEVGNKGYLNWSQVKEMHKHGMTFGSHGLNHKSMNELSDKETQNEFIKSKSILEDAIGSSVKYFSYPFGHFSKKSHILGLSAGYDFLFTSNHGIAKKNSKILPRNNIHSGLDQKKILRIMNPGLSLQLRWKIEDQLKISIKNSIGIEKYKKIRNKIFLKSN